MEDVRIDNCSQHRNRSIENSMSTYTKNDLVVELARILGISRRKVSLLLEQQALIAYRETREGGFTIPGLCRFDVVRRKARRARNPRTGETLLIAEHDMVRVRHLKKVRDMVTPPPPGLVTVLPVEPVSVQDAPVDKATPDTPTAWQPLMNPDGSASMPTQAVPPPATTPPVEIAEKLISFCCKNPDCRQEIEAYQDMAGSSAECPACGSPVEVPYFSEPGTLHGPVLPEAAAGETYNMASRTIRIELPDDDVFG